MSRNKDIKFLHEVTGKPYKECRALMKANGWDLWRAFPLPEIIAKIPEIINRATDEIVEALNSITEATRKMKDILVESINNAINES